MKKTNIILLSFLMIATLQSCQEKEVVEVEITEPVTEEITLGNPADAKADGKFQMSELSYSYNALEPNIDGRTMEIHYSKHHLGYTNNLNKAIAGTDLEDKTIEEILTELDLENKTVRNNAGGYYNHNLFWEILSPEKTEPSGVLLEKINADFGSVDTLVSQLKQAGSKQFGSGWAWLVVNKEGKLQVGSTANQDNPLMPNMGISGTPILGIDVWEHAYYLNYQNKRADYLDSIFGIINWDRVAEKYAATLAQ
ncbi:MAG: superoxide dismutase [Flavobacteriaceae bacterium]